MALTVIYLGDGDVGEAVVYGLPFVVGVPVTLPEGFEFLDKILSNGTFEVVTAEAPAPVVVEEAPKPRRGRPPNAGK
jgi:hypothetical protein